MTTAQFETDCIVIGSGPAGVSAACALVERGVQVFMIDGAPRYEAASNETDISHKMLGRELEALLPEDGLSPKLRTPAARKIAKDFTGFNKIRGDGFVAVGSMTRGGLSKLWGGLVCEFDADDIRDWPVSIEQLRASYKAVTERIGVSGSDSDAMAQFYGRSGDILAAPELGPSAARILHRFQRESLDPDFCLGLARNAILTIDRDGRHACDLRKDCLWGCPRGAVYDARFDLATLERHPTFQLIDDARATRLLSSPRGWEVHIHDGRILTAQFMVLAAGALSTAMLVVPVLPNAPAELPLLNNPVAAVPLLVPSRLGQSGAAQGYSLAQLGYRFHFGSDTADYATGAVYEIDGLPTSSFTARLPFSRRAGAEFFDAIAPALLASTCYFPGAYSKNVLRWSKQNDELSMVVQGGHSVELPSRLAEVTRRLRKIWWRLGALMLPGTSLAVPGTDVHYAGPFGMGLDTAYGTTMWGELNAAPGIFIADGASIPTLPSKYPTLSIMANADRIGRHLASKLRERDTALSGVR